MSSKYNITLKIKLDDKNYEYVGRFLGFMKNDEFNAMVQNIDKVAGKIESRATQSLIEMARSVDNLPASRLVMTVKKFNGEEQLAKKLFVSPRCHFISSVGATEVIIELEDTDNQLVIEEEVEK